MPQVQVAASKVVEALQPLHKYKQLTMVLQTMAREIERLHEDNQQLRAALVIYREVDRRQKLTARVGKETPRIVPLPGSICSPYFAG